MNLDGCEFPDGLLYDRDGLVWIRVDSAGEVLLGITSIQAAIGGKLTRISPKPLGVEYAPGRAVGMIESGRFFGPIRTPIRASLSAVNAEVLRRPRTMCDAPYGDGWFARLRPLQWEQDRQDLVSVPEAARQLRSQIANLRIRCFAAFPDHELIEIGTECAAALAKLDELVARIEVGEVIHIVSDDTTAPIEMIRWSDRARHPIVDSRVEGNLFHFLVRKAQ